MADESNGEKTEKPSAKKLRDARERGEVVRSQDFVSAVGLLAVTMAMAQFGPALMARLGTLTSEGLRRLPERGRATATPEAVTALLATDLTAAAVIVGPLLLVAALASLAAQFAQTGWVFAPARLTLNWERLSPAQGLSRLKPSQSWVNLIKSLVIAIAIVLLARLVINAALDAASQLARMAPEGAAIEGWRLLRRLLLQAGLAIAVMAGADYGLQYWRRYQSLKMTRQELTDESKSSEGNPEIKARVRRVQRDMVRNRMMAAVKTATVVVSNPTHFAVALEYRRATMRAPVVVAKGQDELAQRIKRIARDHNVPVVENVALARALYRHAEVGDTIPGDLFNAVAEMLAYLVRLKQVTL